MTKSNGNGAEKRRWFSKPHNKELVDMIGKEEAEEVMEEDLRRKQTYDEIDKTLATSKIVTERLKKKNLLASLRSMEIANNGKV